MYTIITIDKCKFCDMAKNLLVKEGIKFREKNVTNDEEERQKLIAAGLVTVPQVYDELDNLIGGYTELAVKFGKLDLSWDGV